MARNFTGTSTNTAATNTIDGGFTSEVYVKNTGSNGLHVNIPNIHGATDYDTIAAGDTEYYGSQANIGKIIVKSAVTDSHTTYTAGVTRGTAQ